MLAFFCANISLAMGERRKRDSTVNLEAIKTLVAVHGQRKAARIAGLNENTVKSWARLYHWKTPNPKGIALQNLSEPIYTQSPSNALVTSLDQLKKDSILGLATFSANAAKEAAKAVKPLDVARKVRDAAAVHSTIWPNESGKTSILQIGVLIGQQEPRKIE